jgi:hypothetical protein
MSIHHMMATDYYGTPSYRYDTFVTVSSRRSVATQFLDSTNGCRPFCTNLWQTNHGDRAFWLVGIGRIRDGKISQANWTFWPASRPGGPFIRQSPSFGGVFHHGIVGDNGMALSNDAQIAMEQGIMIAEVNIAIGAIDRILKMTKDGKSNNRELTNARVELDHWRARLLKAVHKS